MTIEMIFLRVVLRVNSSTHPTSTRRQTFKLYQKKDLGHPGIAKSDLAAHDSSLSTAGAAAAEEKRWKRTRFT